MLIDRFQTNNDGTPAAFPVDGKSMNSTHTVKTFAYDDENQLTSVTVPAQFKKEYLEKAKILSEHAAVKY